MTEHPRTCAVVPVKSLAMAKQRLSGMFSRRERYQLSLEMLSDVVVTLRHATGVNSVAIISRDPHVINLSRAWGVRLLRDSGTCVNQAIAEAGRVLHAEGYGTMLVVPGDVPLATAKDFEKILSVHGACASVTLVPDRRGTGTNALACSPPTAIVPCFGRRSLKRHEETARKAGLTATVLELENLGLDIDVPEDVLALTKESPCTHTHQYLTSVLQNL